jgi:X-Pro dipeptidyl-peptidase
MERHSRRIALALAGSALMVVAAAGSAFAVNTVTQVVNGGALTASIADLTLTAATYSHSNQDSSGTMVLTADDSTGTGDGWNVTVQSSAFVYSGTNGGTNIPAANFLLTSAATPVQTAGQAVDGTDGPKAVTTSGTLDVARETIDANANFGQGTYTQDLGVTLTIPGQSRAGTYTGTMTVTIAAGPGL